ncbi:MULTISPECIES: hypothetical protein [unclassified Bradyrhizobium]|uniref:hypothetical protein n=1 Tax=unclassified Bradyrhizobium TaxID=2631580 RepID=UPI001BA88921|nr:MULTISPECIES: hypothetical protein [unclassified Bradyrhizobium]MBR1226442.1 hypothetical protein [Bradyrhizobium sp. AUGA SZCCT0176]MBR1301674.1 hypothetical protein [Bradyrhizobium sp. AUGA SZCCT0042]
MSVAELRITYRPDDDGTGQIIATAQSGAFSAQGSAWIGPDQVKHTFVASLRAFPLTSPNPPTIEGGFWSGDGTLDQCHLRITIKPYNSRGTLLVCVDLASESSRRTPDADVQNCATIRFLAEYAAVGGFADQLERALYCESEEAILKGFTN